MLKLKKVHVFLVLPVLAFTAAFLKAGTAEEPKVISELPGKDKINWNLRGLEDRFTIVRVRFNPEQRVVSWLVETKTEGLVKSADLATGIFDEDRVRLGSLDIQIVGGIEQPIPPQPGQPAQGGLAGLGGGLGGLGGGFGGGLGQANLPVRVEKGERIRLLLNLPEEAEWENVRFVMAASKALPEKTLPEKK